VNVCVIVCVCVWSIVQLWWFVVDLKVADDATSVLGLKRDKKERVRFWRVSHRVAVEYLQS